MDRRARNGRRVVLTGDAGPVVVERGDEGVPRIAAESLADAQLGLGFCHARDRGLQMELVRISGRGRICESLDDSDEMLEIDRFFRRLDFDRDAAEQAESLGPAARAGVEAYCRGINTYYETAARPWELRLLGGPARVEPWGFADVYLTAKVVGFVTLAQTQGETERLLVQCVQQGVGRAKLEELFPGLLGGLDEALLKRVRLGGPLAPVALRWAAALPHAAASNNWAVAGSKTASGQPFLCSDPHLQVNRLPAVWYEAVLQWKKDARPWYAAGATMPGSLGVVIGRNPEVAWGVTYAYMDNTDSWVEECRAGRYRREGRWLPFSVRREEIRRKRGGPVVVDYYENDHGVLDGDPNVDGFYLATRWAGAEQTGADALDGILGVQESGTAEESLACLARVRNSSWNWVAADRSGGIGYQMGGQAPLRRPGVSGLVPLPGWDPTNDWRGFARAEDLPRLFNPPEGYIATANDDLNALGRVRPTNQCSGPYRADRIREVLAGPGPFTLDDMKALQLDLRSGQAARYMALLRPLLEGPDRGESGRILAGWDLRYDDDSKGAFVFEQFYRALVEEVFGIGTGRAGDLPPAPVGDPIVSHLLDETAFFVGFFWNFDRILLAEHSAWFGGRTREQVYRAALDRALRTKAEPYGLRRRVLWRHLVFGGKLPRRLGFDRGPIPLHGGRATVRQGQIYDDRGKETAIGPSYRLVVDLATDQIHSALPGGPSDRRTSRWYASELEGWAAGRYKSLSGHAESS